MITVIIIIIKILSFYLYFFCDAPIVDRRRCARNDHFTFTYFLSKFDETWCAGGCLLVVCCAKILAQLDSGSHGILFQSCKIGHFQNVFPRILIRQLGRIVITNLQTHLHSPWSSFQFRFPFSHDVLSFWLKWQFDITYLVAFRSHGIIFFVTVKPRTLAAGLCAESSL